MANWALVWRRCAAASSVRRDVNVALVKSPILCYGGTANNERRLLDVLRGLLVNIGRHYSTIFTSEVLRGHSTLREGPTSYSHNRKALPHNCRCKLLEPRHLLPWNVKVPNVVREGLCGIPGSSLLFLFPSMSMISIRTLSSIL